MIMGGARNTLKVIAARAFACPSNQSVSKAASAASTVTTTTTTTTSPVVKGGGNPVTIFLWSGVSNNRLSPEVRSRLAQGCEWESVVAHVPLAAEGSNTSSNSPRFYFYMPSGEEVSFCAHAAMGACAVVANFADGSRLIEKEREERTTVRFQVGDGTAEKSVVVASNNEVELYMGNHRSHYEEMDVGSSSSFSSTVDALLHQIGLERGDVADTMTDTEANITPSPSCPLPPILVNSSVARFKTMIPITDPKRLHAATNPVDAHVFRDLCDSIGSTGVYLYAPIRSSSSSSSLFLSNELECRQFPRASGYPEDPATGIAASALVSSLHKYSGNGNDDKEEGDKSDLWSKSFHIYQGTAMGRRSKINIRLDGGGRHREEYDFDLFCSGFVEIDSIEEMDFP